MPLNEKQNTFMESLTIENSRFKIFFSKNFVKNLSFCPPKYVSGLWSNVKFEPGNTIIAVLNFITICWILFNLPITSFFWHNYKVFHFKQGPQVLVCRCLEMLSWMHFQAMVTSDYVIFNKDVLFAQTKHKFCCAVFMQICCEYFVYLIYW